MLENCMGSEPAQNNQCCTLPVGKWHMETLKVPKRKQNCSFWSILNFFKFMWASKHFIWNVLKLITDHWVAIVIASSHCTLLCSSFPRARQLQVWNIYPFWSGKPRDAVDKEVVWKRLVMFIWTHLMCHHAKNAQNWASPSPARQH